MTLPYEFHQTMRRRKELLDLLNRPYCGEDRAFTLVDPQMRQLFLDDPTMTNTEKYGKLIAHDLEVLIAKKLGVELSRERANTIITGIFAYSHPLDFENRAREIYESLIETEESMNILVDCVRNPDPMTNGFIRTLGLYVKKMYAQQSQLPKA